MDEPRDRSREPPLLKRKPDGKRVYSSRGGYRAGGGRPKGAVSRMAKEAREQARLTGMLPHEILLSMARGEPQERAVIDPATGKQTGRTWQVPDLEQSKDAAKAAAPYYAPKISTVEVITNVSDEQLDEFIARAAAEAGISLGAGGEGAPDEDPEG